MVTCNHRMRLPRICDGDGNRPWPKLQYGRKPLERLKLKSKSSRAKVMKGCRCCYRGCWRMANSKRQQRQQHDKSDLTFAFTTMETDESSKKIKNQSTESALTTTTTTRGVTVWRAQRNRFTCTANHASGCDENSNLYLDNGSVNSLLASTTSKQQGAATLVSRSGRRFNSNNCGAIKYVKGNSEVHCGPIPGKSGGLATLCKHLEGAKTISRSPKCCHQQILSPLYGWQVSNLFMIQVGLVMMLSVCSARAGFWTFYFPNYLKASGYKELTDMIESVEKHINSTLDAHADAMYFWKLTKQVGPGGKQEAIEYAKLDFAAYMEPHMLYREHLLKSRDLWFPDGLKSKRILPRQFELDLYKKELKLKIATFEKLANEPILRQMREELVNIWRDVKRNLDTSLPCQYLRYAYRHMGDDLNQFALDMNLKSLNQAMEMLESSYKRIALYKKQDLEAIEGINDDMERVQHLVMID